MKALLLALLLIPGTLLADSNKAFNRLRAVTLHIAGDLGSGSGALVRGRSGKTYMLTNWHVCIAAMSFTKVHGSLEDGTAYYGSVSSFSVTGDLCAVEVTHPKVTPLQLAEEFPFDASIYTRGFPRNVASEHEGRYIGQFNWSAQFPISEVGECPAGSSALVDDNNILVGCQVDYNSYLTTLFAAPGASGSPVVDAEGNLIGVMQANGPKGSGLVPFGKLKHFIENL